MATINVPKEVWARDIIAQLQSIQNDISDRILVGYIDMAIRRAEMLAKGKR